MLGPRCRLDGSDHDEDDAPAAPSGYIPDLRMEPAAEVEKADASAHEQERLYAALEGLDGRSRTILQARWLGEKKATLHQLAGQFGVSAERIRQIEKAAMKKLQGQLAA